MPKNFKKKTDKETPQHKQISDMSKQALLTELDETKYKYLSSTKMLGGCLGIGCAIIDNSVCGYGWHYGDIIGWALVAFVPGAIFIGGCLEDEVWKDLKKYLEGKYPMKELISMLI